MPKPITIALDRLTCKRALQRRDEESKEAISRYADLFTEHGIEALPPVLAFCEDPKDDLAALLVADGFHRVKAARKAGLTELRVEIRKGTERDALLYALGANADHGIPLTLAERRANAQAILADEEWRQWSNIEISKRVHLSPNTIEKIRKTVAGAEVSERKGKDGVVRKKAKRSENAATTGLPTKEEIDATYACQRIATAKGVPRLKKWLTLTSVDPGDSGVFVLTSGTLTRLVGEDEFRALYPDAPIGRYDDLVNPETGYRGIVVQIGAQSAVCLGNDLKISLPLTQLAIDQHFKACAALVAQHAAGAVPADHPPVPSGDAVETPNTLPRGSLREEIITDTQRLLVAGCNAPCELVARIVSTLYHLDSLNERISLRRLSDVCGHPLDLLSKMINTVPQVASLTAGERTYFLKPEVDAEVDACLSAEPEELQVEGQAKPADAPRPPKRTTAPLADRRARWIREELAQELENGGKPAMNEQELFALALLVGIDTATEETWEETFVQSAIGVFHQRLADNVADRLRKGDTAALPDWRTLARLWGIDADGLQILAQRAIPE